MVDDPRIHVSVSVAGETEAQRQARLEAGMEAKRISDLIDEEIQREERMLRKSPKSVKMLLLGALVTRQRATSTILTSDVIVVKVKVNRVCLIISWNPPRGAEF